MDEQVSRDAFVQALQLRMLGLSAEQAWHAFAYGLAERLRCADFELLSGLAAKAIRECDSHVAEKQAAVALVAFRNYLLEPWETDQPEAPDLISVECDGSEQTGVEH